MKYKICSVVHGCKCDEKLAIEGVTSTLNRSSGSRVNGALLLCGFQFLFRGLELEGNAPPHFRIRILYLPQSYKNLK